MNETLENTRLGSIRNVAFLMDGDASIKTTEGVIRADALMLNSSRRISIPHGKFPPVFEFRFFTHGVGDAYFRNRDRMREALSNDSPAVLVGPFDKNVTVTTGIYETEQSFGEINKCYFDVTFKTTDTSEILQEAETSSPVLLQNLSLAANRAAQDAASAAFNTNTKDSLRNAKALYEGAASKLKGKFATLGNTLQKGADYAQKAIDVVEKAAFYANNPVVGFAAMADLVLGVDGLTIDALLKFKKIKSFFNFDTDTPVPINPTPITSEESQNKINYSATKKFMETTATAEAVNQISQHSFASDDEIQDIKEILNDQFQKTIASLSDEGIPDLYRYDTIKEDYTETIEAVEDLAVATNNFLNQQAAIAPTVATITVAPQPICNIAYALYGDDDHDIEIMELNGITDGQLVSGDIKVLVK